MRAPSWFSRSFWRRAAQGPLPPAGQGLNVRSTTTVDPADIPPPMGPAGHVRVILPESSPTIAPPEHVYYSDQPFWNQRRAVPTIQELADRLAPYNATRAPGRQAPSPGTAKPTTAASQPQGNVSTSGLSRQRIARSRSARSFRWPMARDVFGFASPTEVLLAGLAMIWICRARRSRSSRPCRGES